MVPSRSEATKRTAPLSPIDRIDRIGVHRRQEELRQEVMEHRAAGLDPFDRELAVGHPLEQAVQIGRRRDLDADQRRASTRSTESWLSPTRWSSPSRSAAAAISMPISAGPVSRLSRFT